MKINKVFQNLSEKEEQQICLYILDFFVYYSKTKSQIEETEAINEFIKNFKKPNYIEKIFNNLGNIADAVEYIKKISNNANYIILYEKIFENENIKIEHFLRNYYFVEEIAKIKKYIAKNFNNDVKNVPENYKKRIIKKIESVLFDYSEFRNVSLI